MRDPDRERRKIRLVAAKSRLTRHAATALEQSTALGRLYRIPRY